MLAGSAAATTVLVSGGAKAAPIENYYMLIFLNPADGREEEFNTFYNTRHIIDVTAVPGFVSRQRFIRNETQLIGNVEPKLANYLALYQIRTDNLDGVVADISARIKSGVTKIPTPAPFGGGGGQVYYYRFNAPLIKRTIPLPASFTGTKLVQYDHIVFMNAVEGKQQEWEEWYDHRHSPDMLTGDGIMTSQRTTLARPSGNTKPAATREMVLFTMQLPEGLPARTALPKLKPNGPNATPDPQDLASTRGYTYRQIGPLITHEEAVARKAAFKD